MGKKNRNINILIINMFTLETLRKEILNSSLYLNDNTKEELKSCNSITNIFETILKNKKFMGEKISGEQLKIFNSKILLSISSFHINYLNCVNFIIESPKKLWEHIFSTFDDNNINSLIICIYICLKNNYINIEKIIKLYEIIFSNKRAVYILTEMEIFYKDDFDMYSNIYNNFLGLLLNRISITYINYEYRVIKLVKLISILLKNRVVRPRFLEWISNIVNLSKTFKNDYLYSDRINILKPKYLKLIIDILFKLWEDTKKKDNDFKNINMEYPKNKFSLINIDDKILDFKIKNKFLNDLFFMIIILMNNFYNILDFIINKYVNKIENMKIQLRQMILTDSNIENNNYLNKITLNSIYKSNFEYCKNDSKLCQSIKNFQIDISLILNIKLKSRVVIPDFVLETNIDLINCLKIYDDIFYNFNFLNFENSIILLNYEKFGNHYIKHKYCFYACYYISDNYRMNKCDLRLKSIQNILLTNLINFYIELEKMDENLLEKSLIRVNIINFLKFIFIHEPVIYNKKVYLYNEINDKIFIRFVNFYINDMTKCFENTFSSIKDINEIEKDGIFVSMVRKNDYLNMDKHLDLFIKYNILKTQLVDLNNIISFLYIISDNAINILMSKELGEKICSQLNYYLNEITLENKRNLYNIQNKYYVGFKPINLLDFLIKILLSLMKHSSFILYMSKDIRCFKKTNIDFSIKQLWINNLLTDREYNKLENITKLIDHKINEDKEIEIPDEFCDPLMDCEIIEPIILPETNIIMEKSVILRHLLNNLNNPFNREPLSLKNLEEFNNRDDIKKKIQLFLNKKKEWRKKLAK